MSQSVDRALAILELLSEEPRRINAIAEALGVHHSTALRLVQTLRARRFVYRESDGSYRVGSAVLAMAERAAEAIDVRRVALPYMQQLNDDSRETIHLAVLEDSDVVYVEKLERRHPIRMYSRIGLVAPPHCTGVGKAILSALPPERRLAVLTRSERASYTSNTITDIDELMAELDTAAERGYAIDDEEHEEGVHCIAAPIRSSYGDVATSVSIAAPVSAMAKEELTSYVPHLIAAAQAISSQLGWRPDLQRQEAAHL